MGNQNIPSFRGHWYQPDCLDSSEFDLFIEKEESLSGIRLIAGRIVDKFGYASFSGINGTGVEFTKNYSDKAKEETDAATGEIFYNGAWLGDKFKGTFKVLKGEERITSEGTFEMREAGSNLSY